MTTAWSRRAFTAKVQLHLAAQLEEIGQRIVELRERHLLTQEQAARELGVALRTLSRWEAGEAMPYLRNVERLAEVFNVRPSDILGGQTPIAQTAIPDDTTLTRQLEEISARLSRIEQALGLDPLVDEAEELERELREGAEDDDKRAESTGATARTRRQAGRGH